MKCKDCPFFVCEAPDLGEAGFGYCDVLGNLRCAIRATGNKECKMPTKREERTRVATGTVSKKFEQALKKAGE